MSAMPEMSIFSKLSEIPERHRLPAPVEQREYLIGGELRTWAGNCQDVLSPVCLQPEDGAAGESVSGEPAQMRIGSFPLMDEPTVLEALDAADRAYAGGRGDWPTMPVASRIEHVSRFAAMMAEKRDEVVRLLMWEIGKSLKDSEKEFDRTIDYIRDTIDALKDLDRVASRFTIEQGIIGQIRRAPLGVTLCAGPFNYPLNETFTTLIPSLIMGNTVVMKPARYGVLLFGALLAAFRDSFPPGVINTVYGRGREILSPLMASGKVSVLAFIGTSKAANTIQKAHPSPNRLRCILGLDAKNPAIVLPDADLDLAVSECVLGALSFNGQRCTAIKMIFVHRSVADAFVSKLASAVNALKHGMPWDDGVQITPMPEPGKPAYLAELVDDAKAQGASVANDVGGRADQTFYSPAVLYPVGMKTRVAVEEQFGPVVPVAAFDDVEEPIRYVEESNFGQQVSLFGRDGVRIASLIDHLVNQVCRVNVNSQCQRGPDTFPFTGRKDSAEGTLSVTDALRVFSIRTLVAAKATDANKALLTDITHNRKSNFLSTDFIF